MLPERVRDAMGRLVKHFVIDGDCSACGEWGNCHTGDCVVGIFADFLAGLNAPKGKDDLRVKNTDRKEARDGQQEIIGH